MMSCCLGAKVINTFRRILICVILRPRDMQEYIFMFSIENGDNCIVFENFTASIVNLMVTNINLPTIKSPIYQTFWNSSDRRTERAENHKDQQYCQVCRFGCPTQFFVLHRKSEMQLVCRNDHGQLGIRFCFKWHLLLKHATVSMVILLIIVFL